MTRHFFFFLRTWKILFKTNLSFQDKPWIFSHLLQIQRRVGKENFPLIEQSFYPNYKEMVSNKMIYLSKSEISNNKRTGFLKIRRPISPSDLPGYRASKKINNHSIYGAVMQRRRILKKGVIIPFNPFICPYIQKVGSQYPHRLPQNHYSSSYALLNKIWFKRRTPNEAFMPSLF